MVLFPGGLGSASWQHLGRWRDHKGMALWYIMEGRADCQVIIVRILALRQQSHLSEVATVTERILQSNLRGGITFDAPNSLTQCQIPQIWAKLQCGYGGGWAKVTRLNHLSTQVGWWLETEIKLIYSHKRDSFVHNKRFILIKRMGGLSKSINSQTPQAIKTSADLALISHCFTFQPLQFIFLKTVGAQCFSYNKVKLFISMSIFTQETEEVMMENSAEQI